MIENKRFELILNYPNEIGVKETHSGDVIVLNHRDLNSEQFVAQLIMFLNEQNDAIEKLIKDEKYWEQKAIERITELEEENKELKQHIKKLEKELHLVHMSAMFSTVKSFKGDVSKRYYYSEETDTLYDSANNYGQYDKILDKKEIAMLLNEYETLLNERDRE